MHLPIFLHRTFHFHDRPGLPIQAIKCNLGGIDALCIGNIKLRGEIEIGIVIQEPKPEAGGVLFIPEIYVVNTDYEGSDFHGIRLCLQRAEQ